MSLYHCIFTLHDNVFFATREMGTLYETEKYLHNWALSFALFSINYIPEPYGLEGETAQKPTYLDTSSERNLLHLNKLGIYVFPAQPINWSYQINTFKAAQVTYYGKSKQFGDKDADKNYPINYGRAKELAVGSQYRTYIIAPDSIKIPRWIRLGKWSAKVKVEFVKVPEQVLQTKSGNYTCLHPLNPLDLPQSTGIILYNRLVMPPVSLVCQAQLNGEYLVAKKNEPKQEWQALKATLTTEEYQQLPDQFYLPTKVFYGARSLVATA
ncbi:type I-D CRISPR-associated protein Cas5/Csc1 [Chrysosporum ovalisporum ANA283AFssAo]|uniref:type I-D CRISPR-associated protein Cas5/Csc1 n=1 Tax=Umezakia ovalisporum TaxID=75695 RepID=UPI002476D1E0|nr:type I-D CRISPR-associated protein Cas5/Csc1 [Umezakia ovalisporum]MDH6103242.1 type I-D CRISPR-associated protein Cas5/Csc1 [Umezakia ovalisporum ANA283AFssAo]